MKNPFALMRRKPTQVEPVLMQDTMALTRVLDDVQTYYANAQTQRSSGLMNSLSGMGGMADKSGFFEFMPFWLNSQQFVENMCVQSWVADRFVNMPIDDMFTKPRTYDDDTFREEVERLRVDNKVATAMRTARKYGTGLLWAVTKEMPPELPLDPSRVRPGDLVNLVVLSRYDANVVSRVTNLESPRLGEPEMYQVHVHGVGTYMVHASRMFRFDGLVPDTVNGWTGYERDWGVSNLAHAFVEIFNDASTMQAINHLVQEASIPVQKIQGLADILCQAPADDELSVEQRMEQVNTYKSIYRTLLMDSNDSFERVGVTFAGLPDLLERSVERLAMAAGISATRFLGTSPDGQNSTGDGDMRNDNRTTASRQHRELRPAYRWLDELVAGSAGTSVPEYVFPPLYEPTEKELADVGKTRAETVMSMTTSAVWTEEEAKEYVATGVLPTGPVLVEEEDEPEPIVPPFAKKEEDA